MVCDAGIPLIDLAPFFQAEAPEVLELRRQKIGEIGNACEEWGFFQVQNHGLDSKLITDSLKVSSEFFDLPLEEKRKLSLPAGVSPVPIGFCCDSGLDDKVENKEHMFFFAEDGKKAAKNGGSYAQYNVWPDTPASYKPIIKDRLLKETQTTAIFLLSLISQSLGLSKDFLYEHYEDKLNALIMLHYPPSHSTDEIGLSKHQDGNILSVVAQSEVEGLQILKDDKWITIQPRPNCLVVNVGDIVQVWSNDRYKSVLHRVINNRAGTRYSFSFSCVPGVTTQVCPLPQFTAGVNEPPKYREFRYGEYMMFRFENKKVGGPNSEEITIKYYAI
ncbi:flavonol synthase/flavanone 3-hydroxylase isoform X1 [Selaginella moellendorffii]|uniref:flavonol synthase/flavanone 3-hydroxylase isoform X1 n=1 Tax=Selaginella moellendorffii TaxID=88036 RepID=UPI000D1C7395|nr:flavonol synthase/flavanone 3-hydroxylase isoform X1 [Selaginella moellendorffii]|eukprot:XP_024526374.1 flavonol synthase/flavanone 3-hydroxylase isoform X1 [Selaginella moellendorffii]